MKSYCKAKGYDHIRTIKKPRLGKDENVAESMIPVRVYRGPLSVRLALEKMTDKERLDYWRMMSRKMKFWNTLDLAVYWSDGVRNLLEISRLVKYEAGRIDIRFPIDYFRTLEIQTRQNREGVHQPP